MLPVLYMYMYKCSFLFGLRLFTAVGIIDGWCAVTCNQNH